MQNDKRSSIRFVILLGFVSLFADMTYEGARSITGPYLATFGASAMAVGFVAGFGEFVGYGLRLFSGYVSDRTGRYWLMTLLGYSINLLAVPLLALAGNWQMAAALIIAERTGKAIRNPSSNAMLSHATKQMGHGWGFGLHEAMDQLGAMLGPLIVTAVLYFKGSYQIGFAVLLLPALLALSVLLAARFLYPRPRDLDIAVPSFHRETFPRVFWWYLIAASLVAAGFADFSLIAYHFQKTSIVPGVWIPVFYSIAMGTDGLCALVLGRLFDRLGLGVLATVSAVALFFAPLVFLGGFYAALFGMALWGLGMASQESIMRAAVAEMIAPNKRATAYGIFNASYGLFWFLGSLAIGALYDRSVPLMIAFSMIVQFLSLPLFIFCGKNWKEMRTNR